MIPFVALLAAASSVEPQAAAPSTPPATWFSSDDYPPAAMRAREEGAVRFALDVSATGVVTGCRVVESSGYADLDAQTCASARRNASFTPAHDGTGRAIAGTYTARTRWVLPAAPESDELADLPFGLFGASMNVVSATADIQVDAAGTVLSCKVVRAANTSVDPCTQFPIGKIVVAPTIVDGHAVPATVRAATMISVKPSPARATISP